MNWKRLLCVLSIPALSLAWSLGHSDDQQAILGGEAYDSGLFTPIEDLSVLSEARFTTLKHPVFPNHGVRIKKSNFCDGTVRAYTGYIDVETRHLFFYFFESRNDPDKDDVIFWTNGGPGGSSALGLLMELGPCNLSDGGNSTTFNPYSWNSRANVFFIDQPVGVGFSYADYGEHVETTEQAAADIAAFVHVFFEHFVKFKGRPFHMAGESYAGRYLPVFAAYVYDQNKQLEKSGLTPINLASIMIGNGMTDFYTMYAAYHEVACTPVSYPPILDIKTCVRMKQALPRCQKLVREGCLDIFDTFSCGAAISFCDKELSGPIFASGINPYDISRDCEGPFEETICYPLSNDITNYLNLPEVRKELGTDKSFKGNYSSRSERVGIDFTLAMDEFHPTHYHVASLLHRGVRVLVYAGTYDWICNHVGNEQWTRELDWDHSTQFSSQPLRDWFVDGKKAGHTRSAAGLTFATIDGAGHMVPHDKPAESLELVNRWLDGVDI